MKKQFLLTIMCFLMCLAMMVGCGKDTEGTKDDDSKASVGSSSNNDDDNGKTEETPEPKLPDTVSNLELTAEEGKPANGFTWENNYSEITITGYVGSSNDLTVPAKINGKYVTEIKSGAFENFSSLKTISIPGSVKSIESAFGNCTGLEQVTLGEGVENISSAFWGCISLKKVVLPDGIIDITNAFRSCYLLQEVNIPKTVKFIDFAFAYCENLDCEMIIPEAVADENFGIKSTFSGCKNLKKVSFPDGIMFFDNVLTGCSSLEYLNLPQTYMGGIDLTEHTNLKEINIPEEFIDDILDDSLCQINWNVLENAPYGIEVSGGGPHAQENEIDIGGVIISYAVTQYSDTYVDYDVVERLFDRKVEQRSDDGYSIINYYYRITDGNNEFSGKILNKKIEGYRHILRIFVNETIEVNGIKYKRIHV